MLNFNHNVNVNKNTKLDRNNVLHKIFEGNNNYIISIGK